MPRIVIKEQDSDRVLEVAAADAFIGRDPACALFIEGPNSKVVSGRHARIFFQDGAWWIEDTSRNGTIVDDERLQPRQRHGLKTGQLIGLGESGPRYRVMSLESRQVAETVMELPDVNEPAKPTTAPRRSAAGAQPPASAAAAGAGGAGGSDLQTAALRRSEMLRAGLNVEEATEPMSPSPDWMVNVVLRATNTNQRYEVKADVVKIGRSPDCHVQIPPELGASVSRCHAEIAIHDAGVTIRDAGSRNGTFVNGKRLEGTHHAQKGDLIMLGSGGPTLTIEDLHIVKGPKGASSAKEPAAGGRGAGVAQTSFREPPTAPSDRGNGPSSGPRGHSPLVRNVLDDVPEESARRVRLLIWVGVGLLVVASAVMLRLAR
jgi:pSer/pThr/pTyr-binding forkhead associated (FHA) protein